MKKTNYTILLILIAFFATTHTTEAQIWKNLESKVKDKVEKKASDKLENKIDKTIDKSFDKTEESLDDSKIKKNNKADKLMVLVMNTAPNTVCTQKTNIKNRSSLESKTFYKSIMQIMST